jgi:cell division protein FtsZ
MKINKLIAEENSLGYHHNAVLKVIGVGGGGGNAVDQMFLAKNIEGVEFFCINTDAQALRGLHTETMQLGTEITKGLGAGANPEVGRQAALADTDQIRALLENTDMVFVAVGMGGGTGTGAAPVITQLAKEMGILTVAVVTRPFHFEGKKRMDNAEKGIRELASSTDSLIIIPNNKLLTVLGKNMSLLNAFKAVNNVLHGAVQSIAELITRPGLINVDFADVRTVMSEAGMAMMGTGIAAGENRAQMAAQAAIASPLLDLDDMMPGANLSGARGVLINITAGANMSIGEFEEVGNVVKDLTSEDATVVVGTVFDPEMNDSDSLRVTIVVTGLERPQNTQGPEKTNITEKPVAKSEAAVVDYKELERPTVLRKHSSRERVTSSASESTKSSYLDIPAFLRRQEEVS